MTPSRRRVSAMRPCRLVLRRRRDVAARLPGGLSRTRALRPGRRLHHGRRGRADAGRRLRQLLQGLWDRGRELAGSGDRHRRRPDPHRQPGQGAGPLLGAEGRRRRHVRRADAHHAGHARAAGELWGRAPDHQGQVRRRHAPADRRLRRSLRDPPLQPALGRTGAGDARQQAGGGDGVPGYRPGDGPRHVAAVRGFRQRPRATTTRGSSSCWCWRCRPATSGMRTP